jgi:3-methyladenine DNA glycosylase AlkD
VYPIESMVVNFKQMKALEIKQLLEEQGNAEKAVILSRFFKTGKGEYGEGDIFLGVKVPDQRKIARLVKNISFEELTYLLNDEIHECRLVALLICVEKYQKEKNNSNKKQWIDFYLNHTSYINNWDLVDISAYKIIGHWTYHQNQDQLLDILAASSFLWEERIAMIACFYYIRNQSYKTPLRIAETLLCHRHDLIHKAVGWMLREIGKRDMKTEKEFLKSCYKKMPRTMLRYAIEKFPEEERQLYLKGEM